MAAVTRTGGAYRVRPPTPGRFAGELSFPGRLPDHCRPAMQTITLIGWGKVGDGATQEWRYNAHKMGGMQKMAGLACKIARRLAELNADAEVQARIDCRATWR